MVGGHFRRRPLSLLGLTPGIRLAPVQFELHGSYQVSKFCFLQDYSLLIIAYLIHLSNANCIKFNKPLGSHECLSSDSYDKYR